MTWQEKIQKWRALPMEEKNRLRWEDIPRQVFQSMLFEGEPVSLRSLQEAHRREAPPDTSKQNQA